MREGDDWGFYFDEKPLFFVNVAEETLRVAVNISVEAVSNPDRI